MQTNAADLDEPGSCRQCPENFLAGPFSSGASGRRNIRPIRCRPEDYIWTCRLNILQRSVNVTGSLPGFSSGKPWPFKIANGYSIAATRVEWASRRGIKRIGKCQAETGVRNAEPWLRGKNGGEERLRVRMFRARKQRFGVGKLDDPAQIHDCHPGCDVLDHCEVMADEHVS